MQKMIRYLSEETIGQIAAGQVVQTPVCVLKELVENALDAKALHISIEIVGGGLKLIRVCDDGSGMDRESTLLSVKKHTTSKLVDIADIYQLTTMGFRGEALASIGAVSKMILSSALEAEVGTELTIEGGEIKKVRSCARARGTTVEVSALFYNVPARKKFQKSGAVLSGQLFRMVTTMALSRPEVSFELISNGRRVLGPLTKGSLSLRVQEVLGSGFVSEGILLDSQRDSLRALGILAEPRQGKQNKTGQYLFVNYRYVICPSLETAISAGYATSLEERRYPSFVLHVTLPPDRIDVNVHPQKMEIRVHEEMGYAQMLTQMVSEALSQTLQMSKAPLSFVPSSNVSEQAGAFEAFRPELVMAQPLQERELPLSLESFELLHLQGFYAIIREFTREELTLIDLCAARYALLYQRLVLEKSSSSLEKQRLLLPLELVMTKIEIALLLTHQEALAELGFSFRLVKEETLHLDMLPSFVKERQVHKLFSDMAAALQESVGQPLELKKRSSLLSKVAARSALDQRQFSLAEAKAIVEMLRARRGGEEPLLKCPRGHLIEMALSESLMQRLFLSS